MVVLRTVWIPIQILTDKSNMDGMDSPNAEVAPTGAESRAKNGGKDMRRPTKTLDHYSSQIKTNVASGARHLGAESMGNATHAKFMEAQSGMAAPVGSAKMLTKPGSTDFIRP